MNRSSRGNSWYGPWLVVMVLVLLTACGQQAVQGGPSLTTPSTASFNGVSRLDAEAGVVDVSVSALNTTGELLTGIITGPFATVTNVTTSAISPQQETRAFAQVCGSIVDKGSITAMLTLDSTGSMSGNDPGRLRAVAAKRFISRMTASDTAAVASFDSSTEPTEPFTAIRLWQELTNNQVSLDAAVDNATFDSGGTNVWDAGIDSVNLLADATGSNKTAVLLTDGGDNDSSSSPQDIIDLALAESVSVSAIGLGRSVNATELADIASATGGVFVSVDTADSLDVFFDRFFNATKASGCVTLAFSPVPESGTTVEGDLFFGVNGTPLSTTYSVFFP
ncbi:MAG: vWA domain-containing protein [Deinococcota bacterium]